MINSRAMLINETKQTILAQTIVISKSLRDYAFGLLLQKEPVALLLKTRFGIHTFFMKYAIDVLVFNKKGIVVALKKNMKPNTIFLWNPKYMHVLELPVGTIEKSNTQLRDSIVLQ